MINDFGSKKKAAFGGVARQPANTHPWHGAARLVSCEGWAQGCHPMNDVGSREKAVFGGVAREPANAHHWHGEARLVSCLGWV